MFELIDFLIVNPIINILLVIYNYIGDFGVAMIIFTLLVKFLTWPLVKKQFVQMKLMRKIQPELAKIKKKTKGVTTTEFMLLKAFSSLYLDYAKDTR